MPVTVKVIKYGAKVTWDLQNTGLYNLEMLIKSDAIVRSGNKRHNMLLVIVGKGGPSEVQNPIKSLVTL